MISIQEQIEIILTGENPTARCASITYVTQDNKVHKKNVDLLVASKDMPSSDWEDIKKESLLIFTTKTKDFKCFLAGNFTKINALDLTPEIIADKSKEICSLGNELYLVDK